MSSNKKSMKKVVVFGASPTEWRYSYKAVRMLDDYGYEVVPIGKRSGFIGTHAIVSGQPSIDNVDTITLYLNPKHSSEIEDYILSLNPKRIIFNPGAENTDLQAKAVSLGIKTINGCTLVMLSTGNFEEKEFEANTSLS